jgi:hypothetical protein
MQFYQLEANICGVWTKTSRRYACEPWEFSKMLSALELTAGQRLRRTAKRPIATFRGKVFSTGRFVTLHRGA